MTQKYSLMGYKAKTLVTATEFKNFVTHPRSPNQFQPTNHYPDFITITFLHFFIIISHKCTS